MMENDLSNSLVLGISGSLIILLLAIIGFFLNKLVSKIDSVSTDVTKILAVQGISDEKLKTHEQQIQFLVAKQHDNTERWAELYKEYDMNSIKHK